MITFLALVLGITIGSMINLTREEKTRKLNEVLIADLMELDKAKDDVVDMYAAYGEELESRCVECKKGIDKMIMENIDLKKKLKYRN